MNLIAIEQLHKQRLVAAARDLFKELFAPPAAPAALLTIEQAATYLGCSVSGLRKKCKRKVIRYLQSRPHSPLQFRREWLDDYIENRSVKPPATLRPRGVQHIPNSTQDRTSGRRRGYSP